MICHLNILEINICIKIDNQWFIIEHCKASSHTMVGPQRGHIHSLNFNMLHFFFLSFIELKPKLLRAINFAFYMPARPIRERTSNASL